MKKSTILSSVAFAALLATAAAAAPVTTPPPTLSAMGGSISAVYVYANAQNISFLDEISPMAWAGIFSNNGSSSAGDVVSLGSQSGSLVFALRNTSTGKTYWTNTADMSGNYHAVITTDYSSFGVGALPSAAATALASLSNITYVGFEDKEASNGADWDYNDLIFAFSNTSSSGNPGVPEPLSLSLLGAGLLTLAGLRYRRRNN